MQIHQALGWSLGNNGRAAFATFENAFRSAQVEIRFFCSISMTDITVRFENRLDVLRIGNRISGSEKCGERKDKNRQKAASQSY